jgi:hypothetical protein
MRIHVTGTFAVNLRRGSESQAAAAATRARICVGHVRTMSNGAGSALPCVCGSVITCSRVAPHCWHDSTGFFFRMRT